MTISNFSPERLEALVDFVESLSDWGPEGRDLGRRTVMQGAGQPGLDPVNNCWLVEFRGQVKGFCLVTREPSIGRAVLQMETDPVFAGSPLEEALVQLALDSCRSWNAKLAHICLPGGSPRAMLLESIGFERVREYTVMAWSEETLPSVETAPGFHVANFNRGDETLLTRVQNEAFTGGWGFCPGTVEQIAYRSNMANTSHEGILFLRRGDETAGHCWTCIAPTATGVRGRIAMIGVVPDFRGQGLSRSILAAGMNYLVSLGAQDIVLEVDSGNTPAIRLYNSMGFQKVSDLHWYELSLA